MFSNESKFNLHGSDVQHTLRSRKGNEYYHDCIQHAIKHRIFQMVWGCISDQGVGGLHFVQGTVNAQVYIDILEAKLLPTIQGQFTPVQNVIFQDNSAPCHRVKLVSNNFKTFILP